MTREAAFAVAFLSLAAGGCATPTASAPVASEGVAAARIGETARIGRVRITPLRVIEDSRCNNAHVQCIWAGRVRIEALVVGAGTRRETILTLGEAKAMGPGWLTLAAVCPSATGPYRIPRSAYEFTFGYSGDPAPRPVEVVCRAST